MNWRKGKIIRSYHSCQVQMFWEPEIAQWQWGWRRGTTWEQNEGDGITGLGHWLDLGCKRRTQETILRWLRMAMAAQAERRGGLEGNPLWWFILFSAGGILGAGELPISHLYWMLFTTTAPTIPDPLRLSSLLDTLSAAFRSPAEWSPLVHLTCLCVVHATWCFLSLAFPARALYTKVYLE